MGRDTLVVDSTAGAVVRTRKVYLSGLLRSVATSTTPDPSAIGTVTTTYTHDRAGRVTSEQGGGRWVNWGYDLAGNVTSGGPFPATRTYDGANRLLTEGTSSFDYDLSGNLIRADNPSARIRRGYDAAGRLVADTQWIAQFDTTTRAPNGFTSGLLYALHYGYDRNDRLKWTKYATGLRPATGYDSIGYSYDPNAGMLASVRDIAGNIYAFTYDNEARPTQLNRALTGGGWVRDSLFYDTVSRLQRRVVRSSALTGAVLDETMTFDKVDRLTHESANGHSFDYSALEGLNSGNAAGGTETFDIDPLGRRQRSTDRIGQSPTTAYYYYDAGIGTMDHSVRLSFYADTTKYRFTSFGMQDQTERRTQLGLDQPGMPAPRLERTTNYWYSANRLTRVVELVDTVTYDGGKPYPLYESYWKQEGYWYDALGRRVLTWSWKAPNCSQKDRVSGCKNTVTRAIWSGDQLAYEIRTTFSSPNSDVTGGAHYGRVGYLHLAAIDRPIALWKGTQVVHPIINARGNFPKGTCGTALCSTSQIDFPGARMTLFGVDYNPPTQGPVSWYGSLITNGTDASGLLYRRNRYVDPHTGNFTQADPIGIAGGLNVFGYANGDPITYSDPLGLCPPEDDEPCSNFQRLANWGAERGSSTIINIAAGLEAARAAGNVFIGGGCGGGYSCGMAPAVAPGFPSSALNSLRLSKQLASQAQMAEEGIIIAGGESGAVFRQAGRYAAEYGGRAVDWVKKTSTSFTAADGATFQIHWVENIRTGLRTAFKTILEP